MFIKKSLTIIFYLLPIVLFISCRQISRNSETGNLPKKTVKQLNRVIRKNLEEQNLPSVAVGIWIPGRGDYFFAEGVADIKTGRKREIADQFRIASITKTFTAEVVENLIDEGKIQRFDKLSKYYPDFPNSSKITIKDLLNMRSGIADFADKEYLKKYYDNPLMKLSTEKIIEVAALKADLFKEPDKATVYCNTNYILLGEIVKKVTGNSIGLEIEKRIFIPLEMKDSYYPEDDILPGKLHGYAWNVQNERFDDKTELNPLCAGPAGAIISNVYDLKKYAEAMYIASKDTERLTTYPFEGAPDWIRYGEGIIKMGAFWGHNGTIFGFSTELWYLPEENAVIVINVNRLDLDDKSKSSKMFEDITKILFPKYKK